VGWYIFAFAIGNFMGPLVLGRFFDSVGRKPMIAGTYILSGVLLAVTAFLFNAGTLTATTQTLAWCIIFFFASAGASSAYLTVSEIFPMETRAMAISFFYAVGTAIGGITGPLLFGRLIESGGETNVMYGYLLGAALMVAAGVVEIFLGVEAAQKQLEDIAKPLTAEDAEAAEARGEDVVTDDDLDVDKLKGEEASPVEGGDDGGKRFARDSGDTTTRTPGGAA
jgi:MFS family permease